MATHYWHPFADMAAVDRDGELVLVEGRGSTVIDDAGREYLDATAGLWFCNVGHGRVSIAEAAAQQMAQLASYSTFGDVAPRATLELAERICSLSPHPDGSVALTSGGSDSIDTALKLVLRYWELLDQPTRSTVISRQHAYHGMHLGGTSVSGIEANRVPLADGGIRTVRVPWDDAAALDATIRELGAANVGAFLCEPVIGAGGVFAPPPRYLDDVAAVCAEHDVLFVLDEVITGFGRLGSWFAAGRFGLAPDLIVFAKGVTSGYLPLGGIVASPRVMEPFWSEPGRAMWRHGYTYSGHAACAAAAMANLDVLARDDLLAGADRLEQTLARELAPLVASPLVEEVRAGVGALAAVQLDPERLAADPSLGPTVVAATRRRGVLTRLLASAGLQVSPPLCCTDGEVARIAAALAESIAEVDELGAAGGT